LDPLYKGNQSTLDVYFFLICPGCPCVELIRFRKLKKKRTGELEIKSRIMNLGEGSWDYSLHYILIRLRQGWKGIELLLLLVECQLEGIGKGWGRDEERMFCAISFIIALLLVPGRVACFWMTLISSCLAFFFSKLVV
jgi:hypothetical protein